MEDGQMRIAKNGAQRSNSEKYIQLVALVLTVLEPFFKRSNLFVFFSCGNCPRLACSVYIYDITKAIQIADSSLQV